MTSTALVTSAVNPAIAEAIEVLDRIKVVRNVLAPDLNDQELQLFALVAQRSGLDPFAKQIYAIKRQGRVTFQTGIDGYRSVAARTGQYEGSTDPEFGDWLDKPFPHPEWASVIAFRWQNGRRIEQPATAYWDEYYPGTPKSTPGPRDQGFMWLSKPRVMLGKVAEAIALRKAFPYVLADVYIAEEMEGAGPGDSAPLVEAAAKPTAAERVAARRAAIERPAATAVIETTIVPASDVGLTKRQFVDALAAASISPEYAMQVRAAMYPDTTVELSDAERRTLLDSLTEGVVAMDAPSVPLFTEGEWAETAVAPA